VWLAEDFTATREAEERARQAYDEQQIIFDNAAVGILFARDRMVQRCNRRLAEIFGYRRRSCRAFDAGLLPQRGDYQRHGAEILPVVMAGGTYVGETARAAPGRPCLLGARHGAAGRRRE
jgi:PAS domain-containing protein